MPRSARQPGHFLGGIQRAHAVWLSLLAAMTCTGGMLLALDGKPAPRTDGVSLPLTATSTVSVLEPIFRTKAPIVPGQWKAIVIHHSGSPVGTPSRLEEEHRARQFKGLGHHFLIGNGNGMDDGELHVGYRWLEQRAGAHAGGAEGDWYNRNAVSICLIGDGERQQFTRAQMSRLAELVGALCADLDIPPERVLLHNEIAPTADPGKHFNAAWLRQRLAGGR